MELRDAEEQDLAGLAAIYNDAIATSAAGIDATNKASIRFHERLGFVQAGCLHQVGHKFDRWLDLVFLQRRIGA